MKKLLTTSALLLTLTMGTALAHDGMGGNKGEHRGMRHHMEEVLQKLPEDKADLIKKTMETSREKNKAQFEQLRTIGKDIRAILVAPTFDKDAYLAKVKEAEAIRQAAAAERHKTFADIATQLNQEERKTLAELMPPKGGMHHWGKHSKEVPVPEDAPAADHPPLADE